VVGSAESTEIGRFSVIIISFLITLSFFLIAFFFGVDCIDAGEAFRGDNNACGGSDYQANRAVTERRFLLSLTTLNRRSSSICLMLIGFNQGLITTAKIIYNN